MDGSNYTIEDYLRALKEKDYVEKTTILCSMSTNVYASDGGGGGLYRYLLTVRDSMCRYRMALDLQGGVAFSRGSEKKKGWMGSVPLSHWILSTPEARRARDALSRNKGEGLRQ